MSNLSSILHSLNNNHLKRKTTFINFIFNSVTKLSIGSISLISRLVRGVQRNLSRRGGGSAPVGSWKVITSLTLKFLHCPPPCVRLMLLVLKFVVLQKWFTYFKIILQFLKIWNTISQSFTLIFESESYDNLCPNNHTGFTWKLAAWVENISVSFRSLWIFTSFKHTIFIFLFKINFIEHIQQIGR